MRARRLSESIEDYILTVYRLEELYGRAKTSQIAKELKLREGTVSKVLKRLRENGFVILSRYKGVKLSVLGREVAEKILRKHAIIEVFLTDFLGFDKLKAHYLAHKMEHLPDEVVEAIYLKLGKPNLRYHISFVKEISEESLERMTPLTKTTPNKCYEIVCLYAELGTVLEKLSKSGCGYPCVVRVEGLGSRGISVSTPGAEIVFTWHEGESIFVREVSCSD
ncbi:MAG: metal-dependent transcriptional regulator [Thermoprotei archaeon]